MRWYFKKNSNQTDLFELVGRLDNFKAVEGGYLYSWRHTASKSG